MRTSGCSPRRCLLAAPAASAGPEASVQRILPLPQRGKGMEDADHGASPTTLEVHDKKQWSTAAQKSMHCRVISLLIFYGHTEV
ncbi:hypothetical protein PVAP13_2NG088792 [Panicum virgatum]|uniref:Uncharacterized protein n=1 Tax=Panicum virgatum TaxID=38727 RepID=A0A8T0VDA4_PANVG|nr:hypothetical protein PVAP13_2NG088792 [Panicum virgatum]